MLAALKAAVKAGDLPASHLPDLDALYRKAWVVYCKPPFGSPEQVLAYLARYTHRVAISNARLVRLDEETVTFTWKDYADHERLREMTLTGEEFLRRFLLHVLPDRFVRIRYYGLFANRHREQALAVCREVLPGPPSRPQPPKTDWRDRLQRLTGIDPTRCEVCGEKAMRLVSELAAARPLRGPPR
jgi:putative transposase